MRTTLRLITAAAVIAIGCAGTAQAGATSYQQTVTIVDVQGQSPRTVAGSKDGVCDNQEFCLYTGANRTGSVVDQLVYDNNLDDTYIGHQGTGSWWNRSSHDWYVFDGLHCSGRQVRLGANSWSNTSSAWRGHIRSAARADSLSTCQKG
ncbi:peptidase inhibitor family I36 protein [Kutzneria chonburiensis]|uniref:Peptidase inhibitor family I36 protein n=1 Tax=Kutzneria chonburiensis TaxID=1483604 RepID=A0ABV6N2B5_9PSEU|nr:peptidase inhibitor family I36 protein [Kutzneria chonburiensis]